MWFATEIDDFKLYMTRFCATIALLERDFAVCEGWLGRFQRQNHAPNAILNDFTAVPYRFWAFLGAFKAFYETLKTIIKALGVNRRYFSALRSIFVAKCRLNEWFYQQNTPLINDF